MNTLLLKIFRRSPMRAATLTLLSATLLPSAFAQFIDISQYHKKNNFTYSKLVAGGEIGGINLLAITDSTNYSEVFAGKKFELIPGLTVIPRLGAEYVSKKDWKSRGIVSTRYEVDNWKFYNTLEFGGHTGHYSQTRFSYSFGELSLGLVTDSLYGSGLRADYQLYKQLSIRAQSLERNASIGTTISF